MFQVVFVLKSFYSVPRKDIAACMMGLLKYKGIIVREKKIVYRMLELWHDSKLDIVDSYLIACLEGDKQNILKGKRLKGKYVLLIPKWGTKAGKKQWLLMKAKD